MFVHECIYMCVCACMCVLMCACARVCVNVGVPFHFLHTCTSRIRLSMCVCAMLNSPVHGERIFSIVHAVCR